MPIEIEPLWQLASPKWAMLVGMSLIIVVAALSYLLMRRLTSLRKDRYKQFMTLLAEVLVSVGIIGLVTFAARAKIDADIRYVQKQTNESRRLLRVEIMHFTMQRCLPVSPKLDILESATLDHLCDVSINLINAGDAKFIDQSQDFVDWWGAKDEFKKMAVQVKNLPELSNQLTSIARQLDFVSRVENGAYLDMHRKGLVESDISWFLIALSAFLAMVGVGLKWARAFIEIKPSA